MYKVGSQVMCQRLQESLGVFRDKRIDIVKNAFYDLYFCERSRMFSDQLDDIQGFMKPKYEVMR